MDNKLLYPSENEISDESFTGLIPAAQIYNDKEQINDVSVPPVVQIENQNSFETLRDHIIKEYNLNKMQIISFKIIANHLISSLRGENLNQLKFYVGGEGGTGKSRIIQAIDSFFKKMQVQHLLRLTAPTGKAASIIGGVTIHSTINLSRSSKEASISNEKLEELWNNVKYLIIDEISMVGCRLMAKICQLLTKAKHTDPDIPFGGLNVIFFGDFYQYPPVADRPLYIFPLQSNGKPNSDNANGHFFWRQIDRAIILDEQVRQADDLEYLALLRRVREGVGTQLDRKTLISRTLGSPGVNIQSEPFKSSKVIVTLNELRVEINNKYLRNFTSEKNIPIVKIIAEDSFPQLKEMPHQSLRNSLLSISETQTEQLPGYLYIAKGCPVIITKNIAVSLNIMNGAAGTLEGIIFDKDEGNLAIDSENIFTPKKLPLCLLVKIPTSKFENKNLEENIVPIIPMESTFRYSIRRVDGSSKRISIKRKQFPITLNFSCTNYKCQGDTMTSAVVDLTPANRHRISPSFAYVMLSRVKTLNQLSILRKDVPIHVLQSKPKPELVSEMTRLKNLSDQTHSNELQHM